MNDRAQRMTDRGTESIWMDESVPHAEKALPFQSATDVCIVGAGISGLTSAYLLARAGSRVTVLEAAQIGSGETGRTTAHLCSSLDDRFHHLESIHGVEGARLAAESHARAVDVIEDIVLAERIDCGFRRVDGYLYLGPRDTPESLVKEADAATRAGLEVELLPTPPGPALAPGPVLRFAHQAQMNPMRYLKGLVLAIERLGGQIFTGVHVSRFESGRPTQVTTDLGQTVRAQSLIVATNTPVNDRVVIHTKQVPMRTYAMAFEVPAGAVPMGLYWDDDDPYHYVRVDDTVRADGGELLIVGGEDHRTGNDRHPEPRWDHLEAWTRRIFPQVGALARRWSGQVMEPVDGLGFIGKNPADGPGVYIATGDSGNGMTHGTIAGLMLSELTQGREHPWSRIYDPRRMAPKSLGEYAKDGLDMAAQYGAWLAPGDVRSEDEIARGDGAIVVEHGHRLAIFRDEEGLVHRNKAMCRHLGGVVKWNGAEKTWDCPCHGARYDRFGHVIAGPSSEDLAPAPDRSRRGDDTPARSRPSVLRPRAPVRFR